jgi:hypothetical protein
MEQDARADAEHERDDATANQEFFHMKTSD